MKYFEVIFAAAILLMANAPLASAAPAAAIGSGTEHALYAAAEEQAVEDDADIEEDEELDEGEYVGDDEEGDSDEDYEEEYEEEEAPTDERG